MPAHALHRAFFLPALLLLPAACGSGPVRTGADLLLETRPALLRGRTVGLISNHTGRLSDGRTTLDGLLDAGIRVAAVFTPEHGYRGTAAPGERISDTVDAATGVPLVSLHGDVRAPTAEMLAGIDVLVYDLQDVGVRYYTYISTMKLCMDAAAERRIPFVVLDRPNPQGGLIVDGPVLPDSLRSFLGVVPVPVVYGLTCGELALLINGEGWLEGGRRVDLTVVEMAGWTRGMSWEETGLPWPVPSPNLRTAEAARMYPVTCYLEATTVSEGRGTEEPFLLIGAPFLNGDRLARMLNLEPGLPLSAEARRFTPASAGYAGISCGGVRLRFRERGVQFPVEAGVALLGALAEAGADSFRIRGRALDLLLGDPLIRRSLESGRRPDRQELGLWRESSETFRRLASEYLLYR